MKRCLIVGAGGFGREVLSWALAMKQSEWNIVGFLDRSPDALAGKNIAYPVIGNPDVWLPGPDEVFVFGLGDSEARLNVCSHLRDRGARFITIIHPSVTFGINADIGTGCVLAPNLRCLCQRDR